MRCDEAYAKEYFKTVEKEEQIAKLKAELSALKKNARLLALAGVRSAHHDVLDEEEWEAACRILAATEEDNE